MRVKRIRKKVVALLATVSLLIGMVSVCSTLLTTLAVESEQPTRFVADFSELKGILDANSVGWNQGDSYDTAYTPISDTTSVDGQLNTWMREKFASKTAHFYSSTRAWFAQHSNEISDLETEVGWRNYASFDVGNAGSLRYKLGGGGTVGQMLRRVDNLIPQYNGTAVKLKNFEAKLTLKIGFPTYKGGFLFSFHEDEAGSMRMRSDGVYNGYRYYVTGSTLVIGNGMGNTMTPGKDGWVFYNNQDQISATTVDENIITNNTTAAGFELKLADLGGKATYERFDRTLNDQNYTLTVRVVNGTATFTLESADGAFKKTMTSACDTTEGYLSFGVSNRDTNFYALEITELDDNGDAVDYGTYHSGGKAVEVFEADFTDVPDAHYVSSSSKYLYNANHDSSTGKDKGLTAENNASTVSAVGAFTSGKDYTVDVRDKALVDYLESKFDFYTYGYNGGGTLPMWNAAGYVVDADGNPLGAGFTNSGYNPATGETASGYLPGSGQGGHGSNGMYPTMVLSENKWLHIAKDIDGNSKDPFDVVYSYALNDANGDKAVLKNFKLDLDFKLTTASATNFPQNQSPVFVKFGGYNSVQHGDTDGAMFSISCNGEYFLDDLNTVVNGSTFTATKDTDNAPYYTETAGVAIREAHLTLTVKNGTVNAVVTLADGTKVLDVAKNDIAIQNGLIYIGTTYAGIKHGLPYFGAVKVVRLDDKGNPIDFTDGDKGAFDASFVGLTDVVDGNYYRNLGTKGNAIMTGKSTPWMSNKTAVGSGYAFSGDDTNVVNYLNEKFEFYHTDLTGKVHEMPTSYTTTEELQADKWAPTAGRWILFNGNRLRASFGAANGELFRKSLTVVPKIQGEAVYAADFEMEFDYSIESVRNGIYYPGGVALTFRSPEKAKTTTSAGGYADAVTLVFTREKMILYDNVAPDYKYDDVQADEGALLWNNSNTNVGAARVKINVVGNTMSLKVTSADGTTELYSDDNITLSRLYAGYVYLTALNSDVALGDIAVKPLYAENYLAVPTNLLVQNGTVFGLDSRYTYEYKKQNAAEWTAVPLGSTEIAGLKTDAIYEVRLAANQSHAAGAAVVVQLSSYDLENTVQYNFEEGTQLDAFDTWFVPTIHYNNAAIETTGTSNTNWYIENGKLRYKTSALYNAPAAYKSGVQLNGQNWLCSYASAYNSNMGIAVLKTKQYKNFILDFDFTGSPYWTTVGFGADNTSDGVFWTTQKGGYNLFLEYDGGKGASDFHYMTADGLKSERATGAFEYNASGLHHMRVIVTDNTAYMSVDDQPTWVVDIPSSYDGGYIFFALNNTTTTIDNVQVVDLDAKEIVITELVKSAETAEIDRAAGESLQFFETVYGLTADGYQYPLLVDFESDDYRSYINGTFALNMKLKSLKNISFSDDFDGVLSVVNKVDYDTDTSRKYYFDHPNDFKDFGGYYSQPTTSNGYWSNANDTGSTTEKNRKWSAYDGDLVSIDPTQKWEINKGSASVNYIEDNGGASTVARMRNLSTLIYKGHTLTNFRMEYDVKKGSTWWYNYALIGVQDPTKYVYKLNKTSDSLSTGENAGTVKHDATKDAGVYAFLEQEGYFNIFGNTAGGNSDRVDADAVTVDGNAYEFIANYDRDAWHHVTIEVVNGVMKWTVDDSFAMYYELDYDAYGGYVGFGSYATGSQFDNFQITALNASGEAVDISTAEQGGAKQKESITKPNAWVPSFKFSWN